MTLDPFRSLCARRLVRVAGAVLLAAVPAAGCFPKSEETPDAAPEEPDGDKPLPSAKAVSLAVGEYISCAITDSGAVRCWGSEVDAPTLGTGEANPHGQIPRQVAGITSGAISVSIGYYNACAIVTGGKVKCWGTDQNGELGADVKYTDNRRKESTTPLDVVGLSNVKQVAIGWSHLCALTTGGAVSCWGTNGDGQLGNTTIATQSSVPVPVSGLTSGIVAIAAGSNMSFAVTSAGALKAWGGSFGPTPVDVAVQGVGSGIAAASWGAYDNGRWSMCLRTTAGGAKCFGTNNGNNQLGNGTDHGNAETEALPVAGITSGVTGVSLGSIAGCATVSGSVRCWGSNLDGQLGNGAARTVETWVPVAATGLTGRVSSVGLGFHHACALLESGAVWCWGAGGSRGEGSTTNDVPSATPVAVVSLP